MHKLINALILCLVCCILITPVLSQNTPSQSIPSHGEVLYDVPLWYGTGEVPYLQTSGNESLNRFRNCLERQAKWNFNTHRLYIYPYMEATNQPIDRKWDWDLINGKIEICREFGQKVIIDIHHQGYYYNSDQYCYGKGYFGSERWIQDWRDLTEIFKGNPDIIAFELYNEPFVRWGKDSLGKTYDIWDSSVTDYPDVFDAYARCTNAIREIDSSRTVIWGDPFQSNVLPSKDGFNGWFGDVLSQYLPYAGNMYFTFHQYPPVNATPDNPWAGIEMLQKAMTYVKNKGFNVWLGEFGPGGYDASPPISLEEEENFAISCINFCVDNNIGFSLWSYYNDHYMGDVFGVPLGWYDEVLAQSNYVRAR